MGEYKEGYVSLLTFPVMPTSMVGRRCSQTTFIIFAEASLCETTNTGYLAFGYDLL